MLVLSASGGKSNKGQRFLKLRKSHLVVSEKTGEKISRQYERHERQHNERPIHIAVLFCRGLATRKE